MEVIAGDNDLIVPGRQEHRHLPMQSQITLMFMAVMLVIAVSASLVNSWVAANTYISDLEKDARLIYKYVVLELNEHHLDKELTSMIHSVKGIGYAEEVKSISILTRDGKNFLNVAGDATPYIPENLNPGIENIFRHEQSLHYIKYFSGIDELVEDVATKTNPAEVPVDNHIPKSGYVSVMLDTQGMFKAAFYSFVWTFLITTIAAVVISIISVLVIRRFTRPFNQLATAMLGAQAGEQGVRVFPDGAKEIFEMANAFNSMMHVLELRESRLLSQNNELELRVKERQMVENELRHQSARLKAVINHSMDGVIVISPALKIISLNPAAKKLFSYSTAEYEVEDIQNILPGIVSHAEEDGGDEVLLGRYETEAVNMDGSRIPVDVSVNNMLIEDVEHYLVTARDITVRKENEIKLKDYQKNLEVMVKEQTSDIEQARDAALSGERAMSAFLANMSHEIRTPMHGVLSFASIGLKKNGKVSEEKIAEFFSEIKRSGEYLLEILNDLLDLSKLKAGMMNYQYSITSIVEVIDSVIREFTVLADEKQLHTTVNITGEEHDIEVDVLRITQVVRNLYANAVNYCAASTELVFDVDFTDENSVVFYIENTGSRIPEDELEVVFGSFSQSSVTSNDAGGTGLGLPICKEIIEVGHKGILYAENSGPDSVRFIVRIPRTHLDGEAT